MVHAMAMTPTVPYRIGARVCVLKGSPPRFGTVAGQIRYELGGEPVFGYVVELDECFDSPDGLCVERLAVEHGEVAGIADVKLAV